MKKKSMLCLVLVALLYSVAAQSRICFLLDLECQEGLAKVDKDSTIPCAQRNPDWVRSNERCGYRIYGAMCNDTIDNYYEEGTCVDGYTDMRLPENENYECTSNPVCDCCKNEDVVCKDEFKKCVAPTEPSITSETCVEPGKDASETKYTSCVCDTSIYKYNQTNCGKESFKLAGEKCAGDNGEWYTQCTCAEGYIKTTIANIKCPEDCEYGCSSVGNKAEDKLPDSKYYCWSGANCASRPLVKDSCVDPKSNFDYYWVGYDVNSNCRNLTVDCAELGYTTGTAASGIKCKDKSEPHRCMFDHTKVFCASGLCLYVNEAACEKANTGWDCEPDPYDPDDYQDCYIPSKCKTGYYLSSTGKYCFKCDYTDLATCESENPNSVCSYKTEGCYNLEGCKVSAYKVVDSCGKTGADGYDLVNVDNNGCGTCQAKTCPTGTNVKNNEITCGIKGKYSTAKDTDYYQGDNICKECVCEAPDSCKWTNENKGSADLTDKCCNGNYETCTSSCVAASVPGNATATKPCTGCNETVYTDWECNNNYCKSGSECKYVCSAEYKFDYQNLPANAKGTSGSPCSGLKYQSGKNCTDTYYSTWFKTLLCKDGYTFDATKGECVSTCTYKYDIAHYPNVKRTDLNDSCVRDGVTYYRDICDGVKFDSCSSNQCFNETCKAYNGNGYGTCTAAPAGGCGNEGSITVTGKGGNCYGSSGCDNYANAGGHSNSISIAFYQNGVEKSSYSQYISGSTIKRNSETYTGTLNKNLPAGTYDVYITTNSTTGGNISLISINGRTFHSETQSIYWGANPRQITIDGNVNINITYDWCGGCY
ncbi:MAG: hypothetical protein IJW75_04560 [Alphaproteobacteria bacterium]|nr:hypothetical protein [Alphaproteobacteria bacterium]